MVVGGGADCDFTLSDPAASRRHGELVRVDNGYLLRDLGSTNGTFVRGLQVREIILDRHSHQEIPHPRRADGNRPSPSVRPPRLARVVGLSLQP